MAASQSFVDLRTSSLNAGTHTDDSVWPSFTDIMTVVVMIFLMSLVVILLRNVELVKSEQESTRLAELKASENVELESAISNLEQRIAEIQLHLQAQVLKTQQSDEQLQETQQQATKLMTDIQALQVLREKLSNENTQLAAAKLALEGRIKIVEDEKTSIEELNKQSQQSKLSLEDENLQLILQLKAITDEKQQLESAVSEQQAKLTEAQQEKDSIVLQMQSVESTAKEAKTEFDALNAVYSLLQKDNRTLFDRVNDAEKMITELEENLTSATLTIEQKQQELFVAETEVQSKTQELVETQEQFTALEEKYLKLVGPARSELDKYVVAVRYRLVGNQTVIDVADPVSSSFKQVNLIQLHRILSELKRQKGKDLYTRVVIPSDSGLSYDQAWKFTQDILTQYDYYYQ